MSFEKNEVSSESIINRRNFMGLALASGAAFTLAACSGESTSSSTSGGSGETRKIEDIDEEEVNVPVKPQRVVTLSEPTLDAALALGINPVGTVSGRGAVNCAKLPQRESERCSADWYRGTGELREN